MLRLALVTPFFPTAAEAYCGGASYQIVCALKKRAEITVFCPHPRYPHWLKPRSFDYQPVNTNHALPGVDVEYFTFPAIPGVTRAFNGSVCARYLYPRLQRYRPDIILNYWLYPQGYAAMRAGKKLGIPVVVGSIGSDLNSIADAATLYFTSITLRKADFVVTKSEHLRSQAILRGAAPEKVRVVPNGCDTSIFFVRERSAVRREMGVDQNDALIVYVGRLAESKGLCEALEALTMLHKTRLNVRMVLIGQGSFEETMRRRASALRISDRLIFTGAQDAQQIARWLGAADVFTLPSYAEGCPNVVIEALSSGRPVVATNVGGIPEIVDERCSILVPPRDAGALANALEIALSRNWDERAIASHFRRPWDDVAAELLEISTDLCRKNRDSWVPEKSPVKLFKS